MPTVVTQEGATILISPTLGSAIISRPAAGTRYRPLVRTSDSRFFLVSEGSRAGWLPAGQASIDASQVERIRDITPSREAVLAGPLRATVRGGGNIRFSPNVETGTILGQVHAGEVVTLKSRTADRQWYNIVAPAAAGWVSASLLDIDPRVAALVP